MDWLSGSPAAPGSGVNITRQLGVSLDASTRSSPSGTSMSISSNSKLKAAFSSAGQTTPAVALFSRPTRLSSSRSARVILVRRWQPGMTHLTGTLLGISLILQRIARGEDSGMRAGRRPDQPVGHGSAGRGQRTIVRTGLSEDTVLTGGSGGSGRLRSGELLSPSAKEGVEGLFPIRSDCQ